jgi:hypothetical protein
MKYKDNFGGRIYGTRNPINSFEEYTIIYRIILSKNFISFPDLSIKETIRLQASSFIMNALVCSSVFKLTQKNKHPQSARRFLGHIVSVLGQYIHYQTM